MRMGGKKHCAEAPMGPSHGLVGSNLRSQSLGNSVNRQAVQAEMVSG